MNSASNMPHTALGLLLVVLGCGTSSTAPLDAGASSAGASVGSPCVPSQESSASFGSFRETEVSIDTASPQCGGSVCLVNHFRGRVSCPYGQSADGQPPAGGKACTLPGTTTPVAPNAPKTGNQVAEQCTDRLASKAVICSCRCANASGKTDDGATYCNCPNGMQCAQVVGAIGGAGDTTSGAYCIPAGPPYDQATSCSGVCDPKTAPCP